jgi:carboxyl-terminal processing protease
VDADKATDFINVTRSKFYGIDGISHQFNGVKPDIIIPDFYNNSLYGEIASPYALKADTVIKKVFFNPQPALPKAALNEKSKARLNATGNFNRIRSVADSIHNLAGKNQKIAMALDAFRKYQLTSDKTEEEITNLVYKPTERYQVSSAQFDDEVLRADSYKKEMNDILIKNIINDIYIEESYMIMNDLINQTNK